MNYETYFSDCINQIQKENRYRNFIELDKANLPHPFAYHPNTKRKISIWCSNDYLGMSKHQTVLLATKEAMNKFGVGAGGTRNISGTTSEMHKLEKTLATLHNKTHALVFTSGYVANQSALSAIIKIIPNIIILSDQYNHASIIDGVHHSKNKHIFKHNDLSDLETKLSQFSILQPKIIIFESVYSMNGLISDTQKIAKLAKKYNAITYIDEVHSVGMYGKQGAGIANAQDSENDIDIIQGTLGKAFGVIGGYIAGNKNIIDAIRLTAKGFIFTTALPAFICAAANSSINHLMNSDIERETMLANVDFLRQELTNYQINYIINKSHITSILIRCPKRSEQISHTLLNEHNMYVQHINYPTVEKGTERIRITISPNHTTAMITHFVQKLKLCMMHTGLDTQDNMRLKIA